MGYSTADGTRVHLVQGVLRGDTTGDGTQGHMVLGVLKGPSTGDDTRVHMVLGVLRVLRRGWHMSAHRGGGGARTEQGLQPALWGDQGLVDAQGKAGEHDRT